MGDDSDDDVPLIHQFKRSGKKTVKAPKNEPQDNCDKGSNGYGDEDDKPLAFAFSFKRGGNKESTKCISKEIKDTMKESSLEAPRPDSENVRSKRVNGVVPDSDDEDEDDDDNDDEDVARKEPKSSSESMSSSGVTVGTSNEDDDDSSSAANDCIDDKQDDDSDYDMPLLHSMPNNKQKKCSLAIKKSQASDVSNSSTSVGETQDGLEPEVKSLGSEGKQVDAKVKEEDSGACGANKESVSDSEDDDDVPLSHQFGLKRKNISGSGKPRLFSAVSVKVEEDDDDDDDVPLGKILCTEVKKNLAMRERNSSKKVVVKGEGVTEDADYDAILSRYANKHRKISDTKTNVPVSPAEKDTHSTEDEESYDEDDDDTPLGRMLCKKRVKESDVRTGRSDKHKNKASKIPVKVEEEEDGNSDDEDYDVPLARKRPANSKSRKNSAKKGPAASSKAPEKPALKRKADTLSHSTDEEDDGGDDDGTYDTDDDNDSEEDEDDDDYDASKSKKNKSNAMKSPKVAKKKALASGEVKKRKKDKKKHKGVPGAGGGQKWTTLEHNGVIFPPPYTSHGVRILYNGEPVDLTPEQEEVATFFAVMRDTDYASKPIFIANFWNDWKKLLGPNHVIQGLEDCDFTPIYEWHLAEKEKKKQMTTQEKKAAKEEKLKQEENYTWAIVDGLKEKVGNFRVEPPGLFRGRGEHPKMGKVKRRIYPEDIVINIGADSPIPECPIPGRRWKEIRHDNTVTWLAYWNDPINPKEQKYVFLAASSNLKGQSDKEKYEKARVLKDYIEDIRKTYTANFTSTDLTTRQIAVATYLIDRLALRAGNEKDDDEADTVGCCSLKVEHVKLVSPNKLEFDFLGKDSIRYFNTVEVVAPVYKAIGDFKKGKVEGQDLFDKLDTSKLNTHLKNIMPQLTAKVFRTYNASITLDTLLLDTDGKLVPEKIASYQRANKEVAILCNHQRSVSKAHGAQMEKLEAKLGELNDLLDELEKDLERARKGKSPGKDKEGNPKKSQNPEALEKKILQTKLKVDKMKLDMMVKEDLKTVALGTSKINYMDPRITVAWCKRHEVPIEKVFNKSLLAKFAWAMDVEMGFHF